MQGWFIDDSASCAAGEWCSPVNDIVSFNIQGPQPARFNDETQCCLRDATLATMSLLAHDSSMRVELGGPQ